MFPEETLACTLYIVQGASRGIGLATAERFLAVPGTFNPHKLMHACLCAGHAAVAALARAAACACTCSRALICGRT